LNFARKRQEPPLWEFQFLINSIQQCADALAQSLFLFIGAMLIGFKYFILVFYFSHVVLLQYLFC